MTTVEELRLKVVQEEEKNAKRAEWLKEEVLVVNITFPPAMQRNLGITGYHIRLSELADFLEEEFSNDNDGVFTLKVKKKTNKWIENLPEADI